MPRAHSAEQRRLDDSEGRRSDWKAWGPYVADRAWGTVREDYSASGDAWNYFPHDHSHLRAYRWNEDGLAGFCNRFQNLCLAIALWNEKDPILKERLFGLANPQGNHGEDVKECYFHLDSTPTHSYVKMLYKYPQVEFPYQRLIERNQQRSREEGEHELHDELSHIFRSQQYFDVYIEYAKADAEDIVCRVTAINRFSQPAPIHILPHLWFRNIWSWGYDHTGPKPQLQAAAADSIAVQSRHLGQRWCQFDGAGLQQDGLLFTENETNRERLYQVANESPYVKDAFHEAIVHGRREKVNPQQIGTKAAAHYRAMVGPGESFVVRFRFSPNRHANPTANVDAIIADRLREADEFYATVQPATLCDEERLIQRRAIANLMWSKQFYHFGIDLWLQGDPAGPPPPKEHTTLRNVDWTHLYALDVLSMPDKWEYPYFCSWDLAFHTLVIALVDPEWAKRQLILMLREWYMHPNGQVAAYEWNFGDVNPPVTAWAAWRVYKISRNISGKADTTFLERVFHKLLLNFTWWVNRKDAGGKNIFQGGFLGMDNIGVFDRSAPLPSGARIEQADGTAWMGMFCLNMLAIALELAKTKPAYEDVATKFFEHFMYIAEAINSSVADRGLWNEEDGFYYDRLHTANGQNIPMKLRSFVGLVPLFAVETIEPSILEKLPRFRQRVEWFIKYRPALTECVASLTTPGVHDRRLLSLVDRKKLERILPRMLDPTQFLSDYGIRTLSRQYKSDPFAIDLRGERHIVRYDPAESTTGMFGGNSNWRGPIWFPVNYLMIESLQKYHHYYGASLTAEFPRYSGNDLDLWKIAHELSRRLVGLFLRREDGSRPIDGRNDLFRNDEHWRDCLVFPEYFHGDTGFGMGSIHQGWTSLVAKLIQQTCEH